MTETYRIAVDEDALTDLHARLARTRWPDAVVGDWSWGTPPDPLRRLVAHWQDGYDWRATERRLNTIEQVRVEASGIGIHFFRAGRRGATPLVLVHGWPDSPLRFEKVLPLLGDTFELFVPSIPGYAFSDRPAEPGFGATRVAALFTEALTTLGVERFGVHGGDHGSGIAEAMAAGSPDRVIGLHLVDVPPWHRYTLDPADLAPAERAHLDGMNAWFAADGAYAALHRTKPQTLAYALTDSPVGLAGWFLEKFQSWSDCGGDVFTRFTPDELIDAVAVHWLMGTAASSVRYYRDGALHPADPSVRVTVPTGFAIFPKDISPAPRVYAERFFDVVRWTEMPRGGHFGAWEEPQLFADDVIAFFDGLEGRDG